MRVLVFGGSASGKSQFAEDVTLSFSGPRVYLATMQPFGEEGLRCIERHRALRAGKGFVTLERSRGLASCDYAAALGESAAPDRSTVLLECLGTLLANEMYDDDGVYEPGPGPADRVIAGARALAQTFGNVVVVAVDAGCDVGDFSDQTLAYLRELGRIQAVLASEFDVVVEVAHGVPSVIKGAL
ncbi:MAG: bifunctional adenosylcobinamide kinase/adenosylcobinamide-phosphate guanylyltransferase [Coriobacteriia bacterium]|nr:bifunctional adenosylcobinamide kinase/adenosylcobinamide-phosphate guanylyltransferase [Coriobacteriia bacterium]